jgi:hypothetical protein
LLAPLAFGDVYWVIFDTETGKLEIQLFSSITGPVPKKGGLVSRPPAILDGVTHLMTAMARWTTVDVTGEGFENTSWLLYRNPNGSYGGSIVHVPIGALPFPTAQGPLDVGLHWRNFVRDLATSDHARSVIPPSLPLALICDVAHALRDHGWDCVGAYDSSFRESMYELYNDDSVRHSAHSCEALRLNLAESDTAAFYMLLPYFESEKFITQARKIPVRTITLADVVPK